MRTLTGLVCLGILIPSLAVAEQRFPPEAGTRVRISAPRYYLFLEPATVEASSRFDLTATLEADGMSVRMPYGDVSRLEVSRGEHRMTFFGAVGGAILGGVLGAATTPVPRWDDEDPFVRPSGDDSFGRFMLGAILGGAVGGILGSTMRLESWEPVYTSGGRRR